MRMIPCEMIEFVPTGDDDGALESNGFRNGLKIAVQPLAYDAGVLAFNLFVGIKLSFKSVQAFRSVQKALVLTLEEPASQSLGGLQLGDPQAVIDSPNFSGEPISDAEASSFGSERFGVLIKAGLEIERDSALLFLRICLQNLISNTVAIELPTLRVIQY